MTLAPKIIPTETASTEIIADAVVDLAEAVRKLRTGRLNDKAIVALLSHSSGLPQRTIKLILDAIKNLPTPT